MTDLVKNEQLAALLASGATYAQVLQRVLEHEDSKTLVKRTGSNLAARKAAFARAVANNDQAVLRSMRRRMKKYISRLASNIQMPQPRVLEEAEAAELMGEHLDLVAIQEFLGSRKDTIKTLVFASMDAKLTAKGEENPRVHNASIPVPAFGKVFKREGAGYAPPGLDEGKLRRLLGTDAATVFDERLVPAQTVYDLNHEKLIKLAQDKPKVMEMIREALVPGEERGARFVVRDIPSPE